MLKLIRLPGAPLAELIAARNDPAPLSAVLMTVNVAASAGRAYGMKAASSAISASAANRRNTSGIAPLLKLFHHHRQVSPRPGLPKCDVHRILRARLADHHAVGVLQADRD